MKRSVIYLHAIENGLDLPVGVLDAGLLDLDRMDEDADGVEGEPEDLLDGLIEAVEEEHNVPDGMARAKAVYKQYAAEYKKRFKWLRSSLFRSKLAEDLAEDTQSLTELLVSQGGWEPARDSKWLALHELITQTHAKDKVLVFTQFADTARCCRPARCACWHCWQ